MMWSEKYRPQNIFDMVGNEDARKQFVEWFGNWKKGTKPLLLVGPPGIGKTTLCFLAGKQFGYDMISLNASDVRNKKNIQEILTPVLGNQTVLGEPMIFIDEVDGIHGRSDYGGVEALINILKEPTVPIVLAGNYDSTDKMKKIKKVVKTLQISPLSPRFLKLYLNMILEKENAKINPGRLVKLITDSKGDIRSMINSAQALVTGFEPNTEKSFESLNIEDGINAFFKSQSLEEARVVLFSLRIDPREKINAFYSSIITSNLSSEKMSKALEIISEADLLYGKIMKTQNWRLLRYLDSILLSLYEKDSSVRYTQYNLSWPLLNRLRWDGAKIKAIISTLSKKLHVSNSTFATFFFSVILKLKENNSIELEFEETYDELIEKEIELL
uniref:ATPase central domain-containing protein (RfcL) n=1 Tax=uncultured marine thaumarchaeote KM3_46_G10 TaxID=1456161 RepID=A0A075H3B9_9ARCH|nr:ATPase central domain-containing protein (rfcL) [uncultured marine thaumarchaeote KM3_46_G10]